MRSCRGWLKKVSGSFTSMICPVIHQHHAIGDLPGKSHLVAHHQHGHPVECQRHHRVEDLLDHFRVERGSRLVEQHDLRLHAERTRDRDPLLLAAGELRRIFVCLLGDAHTPEIVTRDILGFLSRHLAHPDRRERAVREHGQMRKKVELLENHAHFSAHFVDLLEILRQFHAIDDDTAALPALDPVDASEQRRLAAAGWPANDDPLAPHDGQIDVAQHVESAEPLVQADNLDRHFIAGRAHVGRHRWRRIGTRQCMIVPAHDLSATDRCSNASPSTMHSATFRSSRGNR